MSESEQKKSRQNRYPASDGNGYYVYCIAERSLAEELTLGKTPESIEEGAGLELIKTPNLAAIVSRVPMTAYGESALAENLTDPTWTAVRAMRHEHVVEYFSKQTSVVPLRFGTIYLDQSGIERMLSERAEQLAAIIQRLEGREEWGVNVYSDRAVLMENIVTVSTRLREMSESAKQASPGQSYLLKKKIEALRSDEAKVEIKRLIGQIEEKLRTESDDVSKLRILKVETTDHGELKAKFAFLVRRSQFESFRNVAEELAQDLASAGIRLELTGPWPAYNFATGND